MMEKIPSEVFNISEKLTQADYKAYLVGGCVRDIALGKTPKDWDIATNAKPQEIQKLFLQSIYENSFGTVAVKTNSSDESLKIIEITSFRLEGKYTDKRHPDEIKFAKTIEEDLARRDFTVNAMALKLNSKFQVSNYNLDRMESFIDPYSGEKDIGAKLICCVGNPTERFSEDALRLMRAVRLAVELGFTIEENTASAIRENAPLLNAIAKERLRDELIKIIMSKSAMQGIQLLEDMSLLKYIIPELRSGINCEQNLHHIYTVWEHNLRALDYAAGKSYPLEIRLAALLHDVAKPQTKRGTGRNSTFYGHEVAGARETGKILKRLAFSKETMDKIVHLVRYHLFYYNVGDVTPAGVRRFIKRVGIENVEDLIKVREADRIGSGVPKAVPYKIRHLMFMVEKVRKDPVNPKMLAVNGTDLIEKLNLKPGPIIGQILDILLEEVLDNPEKNDKKLLLEEAEELLRMSYDELESLRQKAKNRKEEFEEGIEGELRGKFHV